MAKLNPQQLQTLVIEKSLDLALDKDSELATLVEIEADLGIRSERITGTGTYESDKRLKHHAIFESPKKYYGALKDFAEKKLHEDKENGNSADVAKLEKVLEAIRKKIP